MPVCSRCGKPGHDERTCQGESLAPPPYAMPATSVPPGPGLLPSMPPGASIPPGGSMPPGAEGLLTSGSYASAQTPGGRALRLLKTQLALAVGQREEDPERAWLELVSVRERLEPVAELAREDPLLLSDVERFRAKLLEQIAKLTREVGDEIIAPLYSWVDLVRQRSRLDEQVDSAVRRVGEARASRGTPAGQAPATEEEANAALAVAERDHAFWSQDVPPPPSDDVLAVWQEAGGDALRPALPVDHAVVRARGLAGRVVVERVTGRLPGAVPYVGSKLELVLLPVFGVAALLLSMFALATSEARGVLGVLAALGWVAFAGVIGFSVLARQRADVERRSAIEVTWHHVLFAEQASSLELEIGWLRTLAAALRARKTFEGRKGEGGQLAELATWRPDLEPVVVEVAKSNLSAPG
jgi:hypothetical protein